MLRGAFLCISYRGKLRQHKLIRVQCTKKSTRIPVSPVPSTGIRFKKVKIIKTYNPYTKILNFVLLIWEERNSGRYEHARVCRERARAPRARMFVTSQVPFRPTQQYAISCTGCRSTRPTCSNRKKPFKISVLYRIPVLRYRGYRYSGTFFGTLYAYQLVL